MGLKYLGVVKVTEIVTKDSVIQEVKCELLEEQTKPKSYVHWISEKDAVDCQVNLYDVLFNEYNPNTLENYLDGLNKDSLTVKHGAKMHKNLLNQKKVKRFQFERLGFFVYDDDSTDQKVIWNRIVTLQDREK